MKKKNHDSLKAWQIEEKWHLPARGQQGYLSILLFEAQAELVSCKQSCSTHRNMNKEQIFLSSVMFCSLWAAQFTVWQDHDLFTHSWNSGAWGEWMQRKGSMKGTKGSPPSARLIRHPQFSYSSTRKGCAWRQKSALAHRGQRGLPWTSRSSQLILLHPFLFCCPHSTSPLLLFSLQVRTSK